MRTLPRSPAHTPYHKVGRWYSIPSLPGCSESSSRPAGCSNLVCGPTSQERPFPSLRQSLAIGDETLLPLRVLEQWLVTRGKEWGLQLAKPMSGKLAFLALAIPRPGESGLQNPAESSALKEFALRSECLNIHFEKWITFFPPTTD